jgi:chorismate dehydratase
MAPRESAEQLIHRLEREQRSQDRQRESNLEGSLAPYRVGSVPYLNAAPLTRGLEDEITFVPPSKLGAMLRSGELDAGLVSITEALLTDRYDILDGIAFASLGEVFSVFLAHRKPLEELGVIQCDPASLTSVNLLRVLLAERGLHPKFEALEGSPGDSEAVLLIGNPAIEFRLGVHPHQIWDLGAAWFELTQLPFVYAAWALTRAKDTARLRRSLREAKAFGMETLDYLIDNRMEYTREFRKDYLGWHIHFHLGADEKRGVARFSELLRKHLRQPVFELRYVA